MDNLFRTLPNQAITTFRKIEKLSIKQLKTKNSIAFNQTCLNNNLQPAYTKFKLYDKAMQNNNITNEFRLNIVKEEIKQKKATLPTINENLQKEWTTLRNLVNDEQLENIEERINSSSSANDELNRTLLTKKLNNLYKGGCFMTNYKDKFVNLSSHTLTEMQKDVLNFGPNCHIQGKFDLISKKVEIELLYNATIKLQEENKVIISEGFADALRHEGQINRTTQKKKYSFKRS